MKSYINNKLYSTDSAKYIGEWSVNRKSEDAFCIEALYRKKTGEYFLSGAGGELSRYCGKEIIIPLTVEKANEWAKAHLDKALYNSEFGEIRDDDSRVPLTVYLKASTAKKIKRKATDSGIDMSTLLKSLIESEFD